MGLASAGDRCTGARNRSWSDAGWGPRSNPGGNDPSGNRGGRIAPALSAIRRLPEINQRDTWLAQVVLAQSEAGARDASLYTAAEITDDRVRSQALSHLAAEPAGGRGGGSNADFDSLIDLIKSTVKPTSWDDTGGAGSITSFPTGVYVAPQGLLHR